MFQGSWRAGALDLVAQPLSREGIAPRAYALVVHVLSLLDVPRHGESRCLGVSRHSQCPGKHPELVGSSSLCQVLSGVGVPQCAMLNEKLDSLVRELNEEAQAIMVPEEMAQATHADVKDQERAGSFNPSPMPCIFKSKEQLMLRANSLKKALRQIIEQTEKGEGVVGAGSFPDAAATWQGL